MTNAEARCNKSLRPRKPEGSLGRTAQDVHLDSHTAPELWGLYRPVFTDDPINGHPRHCLGAAEPPATPPRPGRSTAILVRDCLFVQRAGLFRSIWGSSHYLPPVDTPGLGWSPRHWIGSWPVQGFLLSFFLQQTKLVVARDIRY